MLETNFEIATNNERIDITQSQAWKITWEMNVLEQ